MSVKIDAELKDEVQKLARSMGLSVSAIVENKLREVARERRVIFEEELMPNKKFAKELREIEKDIKHGRNLSEPAHSFAELKQQLNKLGHAN